MDFNQASRYVGRYWEKAADNRLLCTLCPRHCRLSEGQRGFCFVRQNLDGQMVLTTYGRSSGFCIDPIEKKPLNHFYPGTSVLSFGTAGCNLGCKFCQNWSISKSKEFDSLTDYATPEKIARCAEMLGVKSVAFTYNDPVIFAEYAIDVAKACRARGVKTVAVSAGYMGEEARKDFYSCMDAANIDLKAFSEKFYQKITLGTLQPVLDTLCYLRNETDVWFEVTTLLIPGENDSDEEIGQMTRWIKSNLGRDVPLHFTAFHPDFRMLDKQPTSFSALARARGIAIKNGLNFVYTGNIHDAKGASTYCSNCGEILIERDWYVLGEYKLVGTNKCGHCGQVCPGTFGATKGDWGAKRRPVDLSAFD